MNEFFQPNRRTVATAEYQQLEQVGDRQLEYWSSESKLSHRGKCYWSENRTELMQNVRSDSRSGKGRCKLHYQRIQQISLKRYARDDMVWLKTGHDPTRLDPEQKQETFEPTINTSCGKFYHGIAKTTKMNNPFKLRNTVNSLSKSNTLLTRPYLSVLGRCPASIQRVEVT